MIDSENLRTASLYINNQLLSRGLLRDGRTIEFDRPGDDEYELADTMGRIMAVVNDLILRRDRDAEHRESLSTTLRTLRADSLRQSDNISRLQDRYTEAQRKVNIAEAEEAALKAQLRSAEATIHKLKDDAARTKKIVAESRAACANEVRKRDRQIEALKKAAAEAGRARGERRSPGITTIHVTGEFGGDDLNTSASTIDENYDLRQETNSFLAQLAKGLSDDNENLLSLVHKTNNSLKTMSGWDKSEAAFASQSDGHVVQLFTNPEDLASDIDSVLDHLRTMLTNPSFVPLEEVVVREEEILRLRDGWDKMEIRWQEAVSLIDSWRRRMAADGRPVDMDDLKMGLRLSPMRSQASQGAIRDEPLKLPTLVEEEEERSSFVQRSESPSQRESLHLVPAEGYEETAAQCEGAQNELEDSGSESSIFEDDVDLNMDELEEEEPNVEILGQSESAPEDSVSMTLPPPPTITPLEDTRVAGNCRPRGTNTDNSRKRSGNLMDESEGEGAEAPPPPPHTVKMVPSPQKRLKISSDAENERPTSRPTSGIFTDSNSSSDSVSLLEPSPESTASRASSRTTAKSTRSDASSKKAASATTKATVKSSRQAVAEKKETASRPLTRQASTRATAPTASSSARAGPVKAEGPRTRQTQALSSASAKDMPPPPRPTRAAKKNSEAQQTPSSRAEKNASSADNRSSPTDEHPQSQRDSIPNENSPLPNAVRRLQDSPTRSTPKSSSRLPKPRNMGLLPQPQQSPVTVAGIAAKLAASEREANAARVKAKLRAARLGKNNNNASSTSTAASSVRAVSEGDPSKRDRDFSASSAVTLDENGHAGGVSVMKAEPESAGSSVAMNENDEAEEQDIVKAVVPSPRNRIEDAATSRIRTKKEQEEAEAASGKPRKREVRSRAEKNASRRRSTLSPWELQSLIAGEVMPPTPKVSEQEA